VDEASTKEPAIAYDRNTRRWVRNNDDRGQAGTITIDSKNNNRLTNEHITVKKLCPRSQNTNHRLN